MRFQIDDQWVFAATGGRPHAPQRPLAVFIHGAGMDHSVWALQSRWLAFHGWNALAPDLPGHGRSEGPPLASIGAIAVWLQALITAIGTPVGAQSASLIGHSMGSLAAIEAAAGFPARVQRMVLIGAAARMPANPELLAAAAANAPGAIDMVNLWGHGFAAGLGGSRAAGLWMTGIGARLLERAKPGVLHADLAACDAYRNGAAAAAAIAAPTLVIVGGKDQMTPAKGGRALAADIRGASFLAVPDAGHMLMAERPCELQAAIGAHLGVDRTRIASRISG